MKKAYKVSFSIETHRDILVLADDADAAHDQALKQLESEDEDASVISAETVELFPKRV